MEMPTLSRHPVNAREVEQPKSEDGKSNDGVVGKMTPCNSAEALELFLVQCQPTMTNV